MVVDLAKKRNEKIVWLCASRIVLGRVARGQVVVAGRAGAGVCVSGESLP